MSEQQALFELLRRIKKAHARHCFIAFSGLLVRSLFYLTLVCAIVLLAFAVSPVEINRLYVALASVALSIPVAALFFFLRPRSITETAVVADKHLQLKEKISSALEFGQNFSKDQGMHQWQAAVLKDALMEARRLDLKRAFPWNNPREGRWLWAPALALLLTISVMPQWDLFGLEKSAEAEVLEQSKIEKQIEQLKKRQLVIERRAEEQKRQDVAKLSKELKEFTNDLSKGKIEKRQAIAKLSNMEKSWEQKRAELAERMPQMNSTASKMMQNKMLGEMMQDLMEGNYQQAAKKLESLQKQMKMGNLDSKTMERLGQEMKQLSEMMGTNMPLAQAMQNAAMSMSMQQGGEGMDGESMKGAMDALAMMEMEMEDLQDLMEQMELMSGMMEDLQKTKDGITGVCSSCGGQCDSEGNCSTCNGNGKGKGQGQWRAGDSSNPNQSGMGGPGKGRGGYAEFEEGDTQSQTEKIKGQMQQAPVIGIVPFDGEAGPNTPTLDFTGTVLESRQAAEEALSREQVPAAHRQKVRSYFESLTDSSN